MDYLYDVSDATFATLGPADATFTPSAPFDLNYSSPPAAYTVGTPHSPNSTGTDIQLVGDVLLPHGLFEFSVAHDDGTVIEINGIGTVLNDYNQYIQSAVGGGYNPGPAGLFAFHVNYNECCTSPAYLQIGEPTAVLEPSTWAMLMLGFAGLGFAGYRGSRRTTALTA